VEESSSHPAQRRRRWRRKVLDSVVPVVPIALSASLRLLTWTWRWRVVGGEQLFATWERGGQVIATFWHNRLLAMPLLADRAPVCVIVSHHRDGEIASRALRGWGVHVVRGSASRGAISGFRRMADAYRRGDSIAVLPDGPRGPIYRVKPGVIRLAKATGAPIFPLSYVASRCVRLRSWDRLIVPLPFARVEIRVGPALEVPRDADRDGLEDCRQRLEQRLNELSGDPT
jgi:lysophospholipid acyltransferase (LPLAT)-like uncharacterized protein